MSLAPKPRSLAAIYKSIRSILDWHALRNYCLAQDDWPASRRSGRAERFGSPVPWWAYSCTAFLDQVVPTTARVLELGTGGSTLWWLNRGNSVTAVESSSEWVDKIRSGPGGNSGRLSLVNADPDDTEALELLLKDQEFDVVVVDHSGDRATAVRSLTSHVAVDGLLVLDNADRLEYSAGLRDLAAAGFTRLDFSGMAPINAYAGVTTVAFRSGMWIRGRSAAFVTVEN
ncbi:MAG: class I SAM-dependent methyltransferase [Actinobacteria bacterium]|nr:class I SAM-dependent methyltransferase [Actinomycetota bacterium]